MALSGPGDKDQPKLGKYVGTDANGNNYYEDKAHIVNRDRWVEYKKWNYDTSSVVPEWHQWLHRITDDVPTEKTLPKPFFAGAPLENLTGSRGAFKTYSTTTPKISAWTGSAKPRQG
ncbi:hypothetical protein HK104_006140 [Borealophlyctis nickersoniae]|nr:hypothetical protein HK104_006140 [Borealophlyctis nickersoniae]